MTDHPTYLCDACRIPLCDADDCPNPMHSGAHHVGAEVYCRDCGEVPELKAEVATLRAQVAEAANAARRAERMDTLACGSNLVREYLCKHGGGGDYCNALHRLIGMVACGAHEGAATPK